MNSTKVTANKINLDKLSIFNLGLKGGSVEKVWTRLLGNSSYDEGKAVATSSDGSIYITGYTQGDLDSQTFAGSYDAFLTKYNSDGTKAWTRLLGTSSSEISHGVATSSDNSIYITGYTEGDLDGQTNAGDRDAFLTKYNREGTKVWTRLVGTSYYDEGLGVATSSNGNIYITGRTYGDLDDVTNAGTGSDVFLTKYSSDGTKVWTKLLGTSSTDQGRGVATSSDGSIYITGYTRGALDGETNVGERDAFLTKYDSYGTKVWTRLLGTTSNDESYGVATSSDGSIYITGYTLGDLDGEINAGSVDAFLTKYSSDGTKVWTKLLGSSDFDASFGVAISSDGSIYITGQTGDYYYYLNTFLTKYSSEGDIQWTRLLGSSSADASFGVATASDGIIYITGAIQGDLDGQTNAGDFDAFLTKYRDSSPLNSNSLDLNSDGKVDVLDIVLAFNNNSKDKIEQIVDSILGR